MKKNRLHWLCPGKNSDNIEVLQISNLASIRMRAAVACRYLNKNGYHITSGDLISDNVDIIVVGKIFRNQEQFNYWMSQIEKFKNQGARIYLDYTDNHLDFGSPLREFYKSILKVCDCIIVPSHKMGENVRNYWQGTLNIIPDIIEVSIQTPKEQTSEKLNLFWFGHSSNIENLINYLNKESILEKEKIHLIVMSNELGLDFFRKKINSNHNNLKLFNWSVELMTSVAKEADICLIPSAINDPKKSGASNNRLLTSLALGLPTLATVLPSYKDFKKYLRRT